MMEFYRTVGGRRFVDHTIPELALQLQRIANALDKILDRIEARDPSIRTDPSAAAEESSP
jgi:hypothetical protein